MDQNTGMTFEPQIMPTGIISYTPSGKKNKNIVMNEQPHIQVTRIQVTILFPIGVRLCSKKKKKGNKIKTQLSHYTPSGRKKL